MTRESIFTLQQRLDDTITDERIYGTDARQSLAVFIVVTVLGLTYGAVYEWTGALVFAGLGLVMLAVNRWAAYERDKAATRKWELGAELDQRDKEVCDWIVKQSGTYVNGTDVRVDEVAEGVGE